MVDVSQVYNQTTLLVTWDSVKEAPSQFVGAINEFLSSLLPGHTWFLVLFASAIIGIIMKKHYRMNVVVCGILVFAIFIMLRSFGIGA